MSSASLRPQSISVGYQRANGHLPHNGQLGKDNHHGMEKGYNSNRHNRSCSNLNGWGYLSSTISPGPNCSRLPSAPATPHLPHVPIASTPVLNAACSANNRELQSILKEVRFMTNRLKLKDEEDKVVADWKFAAMVIDRFCLITFTTFTVITTATVLLSAPHVLVE